MNVTIWGMGISNLSVLKWLSSQENKPKMTLIDKGKPDSWHHIEKIREIGYDEALAQDAVTTGHWETCDRLILSPGIDPRQDVFQTLPKNLKACCDIELASQYINKPIIAVTGTNGKTTMCTLIAQTLRAAGHKVFLGGNIGIPICDYFFEENHQYPQILNHLEIIFYR